MNGMGAFSIADIPLIGRAVEWGDRKVQEAVQSVLRRYAEFERAALEAPAIAQDAARVQHVLRTTGTPAQIVKADEYARIAGNLQGEVAKRGAVDQVVEWARAVLNRTGMGALPAVPLLVAGAASVAIVVVANTLRSYNDAKLVRTALQAGFTPEQIAQLGTGQSPFSTGVMNVTKLVTVLAVVGLGVWAINRFGRSPAR